MHMYIPISPPTCISLPPSLTHPSKWSQNTKLISLCYVAASHQLSILHLVVYIYPCHSLTSSQLTLPPPCVRKSHSLRLCLYSCPAPRFMRTIFFFQILYICQHTVFVFLILTYSTLCDRLQAQPPHCKKLNFISFYG